VLAHELGHVRHRDHLRHLIQAGGTSFLVGLLFGDVIGGSAVIFATRALFNASYSREVERDADAFAAETMHALGRPAKPMGELLIRITGTQPAQASSNILASHPLSAERLETLSRADDRGTGAEILSPAEWTALKNICGVVAQNTRPPTTNVTAPSVRPPSRSPDVSTQPGRSSAKGGSLSDSGPMSDGQTE